MAFKEEQIQDVWNRASTVEGYDKNRFRKDACGAWIIREKYGDTDSMYGWVIDHVVPQSILVEKGFQKEMIDNPQNLRALQHENNASKNDDYPSYSAVVTSDGTENISSWKFLEVNKKKQALLNKLYHL
ncbi:MAG: hypothetical protein IJ209_10500 [Bacteroidaceae bacterium]|nr:hypothetical protein [Bacteroidaceae bacterium]